MVLEYENSGSRCVDVNEYTNMLYEYISYKSTILMGQMGVDKPLEMIYAVHNHLNLELQVIYSCMEL